MRKYITQYLEVYHELYPMSRLLMLLLPLVHCRIKHTVLLKGA